MRRRCTSSSRFWPDGLKEAAEIGELLLEGRSLAIWRKALTEGPPQALDVTLTSLRLPDDIAPEAAIIWAPAAALAAVPRPFVRLIGLTSRAWPRHASEDPLLPDHIVPTHRLEPLPVHDADRRDFGTICRTTARQLVCSRSRRDAEGRLNGMSPLYPADLPEMHRQRARIPEHAAGWSDRLFARPLPNSRPYREAESARTCWIDWHTERLTPHDGLIRRNHPVVVGALQRQQSATSLVKLLRDPLGYLWQYGFHWDQPSETEDPLLLDALAFGNLVHATLQTAVTRLEASGQLCLGYSSRHRRRARKRTRYRRDGLGAVTADTAAGDLAEKTTGYPKPRVRRAYLLRGPTLRSAQLG